MRRLVTMPYGGYFAVTVEDLNQFLEHHSIDLCPAHPSEETIPVLVAALNQFAAKVEALEDQVENLKNEAMGDDL